MNCGHHIYKTIWTAVVGQELIAKPDERKGAPNYHQFSIGVFKPEEEGNKMNTSDDLALVDHIPLEISSLLYHFLKVDKDKYNTCQSCHSFLYAKFHLFQISAHAACCTARFSNI